MDETNKINIRVATIKDIDGISSLVMDFYRDAKFKNKGLKFDLCAVEGYLNAVISLPNCVCFVADADNSIVGVIIGEIGPWIMDGRQSVLVEKIWKILDSKEYYGIGMDLISRFQQFAKEQGIQFVMVGTHDFDREHTLQTLYERLGFQHLEHYHIKQVN